LGIQEAGEGATEESNLLRYRTRIEKRMKKAKMESQAIKKVKSIQAMISNQVQVGKIEKSKNGEQAAD